MFTKKNRLKLAFVAAAGLVCGVVGLAAAQGPAHDDGEVSARKAKHAEMKAERLAKFDVNKDGKLDKTERAAMKDTLTLERFKKLDANGDGMISLDEFKAGQLHARGGGMRHHRGGGARKS